MGHTSSNSMAAECAILTVKVIDVISADYLIARLFPAQGQLVADTIGECLWLCVPAMDENGNGESFVYWRVFRVAIEWKERVSSTFESGDVRRKRFGWHRRTAAAPTRSL